MVKYNSLFPAPNSQPHWESVLKQIAQNPNPGWRKGSTFHMCSVNTADAEGRKRWGLTAKAWGGWDTIQAPERAACLRGPPGCLHTHLEQPGIPQFLPAGPLQQPVYSDRLMHGLWSSSVTQVKVRFRKEWRYSHIGVKSIIPKVTIDH